MKKLIVAMTFAVGLVAGVEAAPEASVSQADIKALIERIAALEAANKAQAQRIAELENTDKQVEKWMKAQDTKVTEQNKKFELQTEKLSKIASSKGVGADEGTTTNETGRIWTTSQGFKYYLADKAAGIFEPLSESGLKITPYGYLVFEGVYNTHGTEVDVYTDYVRPKSSQGYRSHTTTFSVQDSILGLQFETPEANHGWTFTGRAEMDLAGDHSNDYAFHWRHLYINAEHESGWSVLFGQTWHLWKMVTPSEIDGAWMENTGHPYRRSPQIRVTKKWDMEDSSFEARIGMVKNGPGMGGDRDDDGNQDNSASAWPLFEAAFLYDHDSPWQADDADNKRWLIGVGGMYGRDRSYRFDGDEYGDADEYNSQMVMIAGQIPFWDFTLTGQIFAGENLGGIQAGVGQRVAFNDLEGMAAKGKEVATVGGFIDLNYRLNADWSFAIGYGFDDPRLESGYTTGIEGITHNDRLYIDVFYQLTDNFKLGLEYGRLSTTYKGDGTAYDDRIQFSAFYDF